MYKFLATSFATLALAGVFVFVVPQHSFAAGLCEQDPPLTGQVLQDCLASEAGANAPALTDAEIQAQNDAALAAAQKTTTEKKQDVDSAYGTIMTKIMSLFAWLVGVAALALDYSVYFTVFKMGDFVHNLSAVGITWRILRDIGNIMLIFGFLAVGITTILNVSWYGGGKKMLPMLLVAAVFLNFSLFFSEAIIDVGNLFATQFYTQINGGTPPSAQTLSLTTVSNEGISNKIMSQLGLQGLYGNAMKPGGEQLLSGDTPWYLGFLGILLFLITAFVMFSLAFILIARFVILIFLIILAPVGFAGLAVPQLKSMANKWWSQLFEQTITAPVLLLMLYIALAVITDAQFLRGLGVTGAASADAATSFVKTANLPAFASFILSFLVAMGLLLLVTITAKSLSAFGAGAAMKGAGALTFGATAFGMRSTVGAGANRAAKYLRSTRLARVPLVGTGIVKGLDKAASGSFDIRGVKAGGGLKGLGVDAGDAQKGGYKADLKSGIEARTKYAGELTGKELTDEEKVRLAVKQKDLGANEKSVNEMLMQQARNRDQGVVDNALDIRIRGEQALNKAAKEDIEKIESTTAKGSQRKYAQNLELGYLGLNEKSFFNKYINPAANTDAAKKIRDEAKKSKDDQTLDALKKALKKAGEPEAEPVVPPAAGGGGGGGAAH